MLDRESELYHSEILRSQRPEEHAVIAITRKGVEISAAAKGFQLSYSNTWDGLTKSWAELDRQTRIRVQANPRLMEN